VINSMPARLRTAKARSGRRKPPSPAAKARLRRPNPQSARIPDIGLGMLLRDAHMSFNRRLREALARHDISFSQYQHLRHLWQSDGLVQAELSRRIGIETASSTAVIDQLEKRGLIRRQRDSADRRRIIVTLTPGGRALEQPLDDCAIAINRRARAGLPDAQMAGLFETMRRLIDNLRAEDR
jgi:MarR family transcriptional regulator, organic hydroperoxide resistance regulator